MENAYLQIYTTPEWKLTWRYKQADRIPSKSVYILYAFGWFLHWRHVALCSVQYTHSTDLTLREKMQRQDLTPRTAFCSGKIWLSAGKCSGKIWLSAGKCSGKIWLSAGKCSGKIWLSAGKCSGKIWLPALHSAVARSKTYWLIRRLDLLWEKKTNGRKSSWDYLFSTDCPRNQK